VPTPALRRRLKRPLGVLYTGDALRSKEFLDILSSSKMLITVGDRVTDFAHQLGRDPNVQIVDEVERRQNRVAPDVPYTRLIKAWNPAGSITAEAIIAVRKAFKGKKPVRLLIDGEEDLLAITAVEAAPLGSTLLYGQPGIGVVVVSVDERAKASVKRTMAAMWKEP
jgi:GTP-dependent dephospho-CoA kinase